MKISFGKPDKSKKKLIIIIAAVLVVCIFLVFRSVIGSRNMPQQVSENTYVKKRDITATLKGSAVVKPKDQYAVSSLVTGEVLKAEFEEGDIVSEGDVLYEIDASDIEKDISNAELAVKRAQQNYDDALKSQNKNSTTNSQNLSSAEIAVNRAQQSFRDAKTAADNLNVRSDISGTVSQLFVSEGDNVSAGMNIARVYDNSSLKLKVPFNEDDAARINVGEYAVISLTGSGDVLGGTVIGINNASEIKNGYMRVRYVTIRVDYPGALSPSDRATASVGDIFCNDAGSFEYWDERIITAKSGGTVKNVCVEAGNHVESGEAVVILSSDAAESQLTNADLALRDAEIAYDKAYGNMDDFSSVSQINSAYIALEEAKTNLEKLKDSGEDYKITAPISGRIITKNIKTGDKLDINTTQEPMAVIYDMSSLEFELMVDELDINKVSLGQKVKVTADALGDNEYTGSVSKISIAGVENNGVTSYPVTVVISEFDEELLPGMNIDAEIAVGSVKNVLAVPKSAVTRDNFVYVVGEKDDVTDTAPEGYKSVSVVTGLNDGNYIEIKSGLSEGDEVKIESVSSASNFMNFAPGGAPGGGGGRP